jgi:hypothetical protein
LKRAEENPVSPNTLDELLRITEVMLSGARFDRKLAKLGVDESARLAVSQAVYDALLDRMRIDDGEEPADYAREEVSAR